MIYISEDGQFSVNLAAEGVAFDATISIEFMRLLGDTTNITPSILNATERFFSFQISTNQLTAGQYVLRFFVGEELVYSEAATIDVEESSGVSYVFDDSDFKWEAPTFVDAVQVGFDYNFDYNFE
jgi:5-hydroxyisourate hydrolase-like protein (transthyretin family)